MPRKLEDMNPAQRKQRIAKLLANAGTRAAVPDKYLPPELRRQRDMNRRLDAPVMPGSSMTGRQLARDREAAVTTQFGADPIGKAQQQERDQGGWYDQYVRALGEHRRNVEGYQGQAQQQVQGISSALGGLGDQAVQGMSSEAAEAGRQASGVRQALTGSFGAMLAAQGANANTYASNLANVVAPGQRLAGLAQGRQRTNDVRDKVGAFRRQFESEAKAGEAKNLMAAQALNLDVSKLQTDAAEGRAERREQRRSNRAQEDAKREAQRAKAGAVNKYGYTDAQWRGMPVPDRQRIIKEFAKKAGKPVDEATQYAKDFYRKYGVKPAPTAAVANARNAITTAKAYVAELAGNDRKTIGQLLLKGETVETDLGDGKKGKKRYPKQKALWLKVALDQAFLNGQISNGTADELHRAGYSVKTLGLKTAK